MTVVSSVLGSPSSCVELQATDFSTWSGVLCLARLEAITVEMVSVGEPPEEFLRLGQCLVMSWSTLIGASS